MSNLQSHSGKLVEPTQVTNGTKRMSTPLEREVKLRFESPQAARTAVAASGATPLRPRRLQSDVLFDTEQRVLSARSQVLRVRIEAGHSYVTFKSPAEHPRSNCARSSKPALTMASGW